MIRKTPLAMRLVATIVTVCVFASSVSVSAQSVARLPLTNDDVIQMVKANLSENLILSQIHDGRTTFDLSTAEVIRLSTAGVSDVLIAAMRAPSVITAAPPTPPVVVLPVTPPPAAVPVSQAPRNAAVAPLTETPPAASIAGSVSEGQRDGELLADSLHTGSKVAVGVVVGAFTGLIGTAIGYAVINPEALSAEAALAREGKTPDYQKGYQAGWSKRTKDKKRQAFLAGGILGTVALVLSALVYLDGLEECGYVGTTYACY